jgi:hypothetical protein
VNLFVAGSSKELPRVRAFMAKARALGVDVTYDWTVPCLELGANPPDTSIREAAVDALYAAIRNSEAFVLLGPMPGHHTIGAWVELAWAAEYLDMDAVAVVGPIESVYSTLGVSLADDDAALAWVRDLVTSRRAA